MFAKPVRTNAAVATTESARREPDAADNFPPRNPRTCPECTDALGIRTPVWQVSPPPHRTGGNSSRKALAIASRMTTQRRAATFFAGAFLAAAFFLAGAFLTAARFAGARLVAARFAGARLAGA